MFTLAGMAVQHVLANRSFKDYDDILMPAHRPEALYCRCGAGDVTL